VIGVIDVIESFTVGVLGEVMLMVTRDVAVQLSEPVIINV
jgi:hypothetical protein